MVCLLALEDPILTAAGAELRRLLRPDRDERRELRVVRAIVYTPKINITIHNYPETGFNMNDRIF